MKQKPYLCEFKANQSHVVRACLKKKNKTNLPFPPKKNHKKQKSLKNKQAKKKELREESSGSRRL